MSNVIDDMNRLEKKIIKTVKKFYIDMNFNILPECMEKKYESDIFTDKIFLFKIAPALSYYYEDFKKTYKQKTSRKIYVQDTADLLAYMLLNSKITLADEEGDEIIFAKTMMMREPGAISISESHTLLSEAYTEKKQYYEEFQNYFHNVENNAKQYKKKIEKVTNFANVFEKILMKKVVYVNKEYVASEIVIFDLFDQLTLNDKYDIALFLTERETTTINLLGKDHCFIAALKYIDNSIIIPNSVANEHPLLSFMHGNEMDIIKNLIGNILFLNPETVSERIKAYTLFKLNSINERTKEYKENFSNNRKKCILDLLQINQKIQDSLEEKFFKSKNLNLT